jgi:5-methylcytosine-specific restriction endonuclease McrA
VEARSYNDHKARCYVVKRNALGDGRPRHSSSAAWKKLRARILARDGGRCVVCGAPATEVDHIDGRWQNDEPANLRAVCSAHNPRGYPQL